MKKIKFLGKYTPWAWVIELTHSCNLSCGHCSCALDPLPKKYDFMKKETWINTWKIIKKIAPTTG